MKSNKLTAESLRETLWDTMKLVKAKRLNPTQANAIAAQSREIMRTVKVQLDVARISNTKPGVNLLTFSGK